MHVYNLTKHDIELPYKTLYPIGDYLQKPAFFASAGLYRHCKPITLGYGGGWGRIKGLQNEQYWIGFNYLTLTFFAL